MPIKLNNWGVENLQEPVRKKEFLWSLNLEKINVRTKLTENALKKISIMIPVMEW